MKWIELFFVFILGSSFGSFFMLLADRTISGAYNKKLLKLLTEPSHCEGCSARISPVGLVPLLGALFMKMRCPRCGEKISWRYPAYELGNGLIAAVIFLFSGTSIDAFLLFIVLASIAAITYADIRSMKVPDIILIILGLCGIAAIFISGFEMANLWGFLFLGGLFFLILFIFPGAFGGGDVKYAALLGFILGFERSVVLLEAALITGSICGVLYAVISKRGLKIKMPFAPFLSAGFIIAYFWGYDLIIMYNSFFFL